jgi:hypothetical protein
LPFQFQDPNNEADNGALQGQFALQVNGLKESLFCSISNGNCDPMSGASGVEGDTPQGLILQHTAESDGGIIPPMGAGRVAFGTAIAEFNPDDGPFRGDDSSDLTLLIRVTEQGLFEQSVSIDGVDVELSGFVQSSFNGTLYFTLDQPYFIVSEALNVEGDPLPGSALSLPSNGNAGERDDGILSPGVYSMSINAGVSISHEQGDPTVEIDRTTTYELRLSLTDPNDSPDPDAPPTAKVPVGAGWPIAIGVAGLGALAVARRRIHA